jgi:hypothetical protein
MIESPSFMNMFQVGLTKFLDVNNLIKHKRKPAFIEEFLKQSKHILTLDYKEFKEYILRIDNQNESTIEYEVLLFILYDLKFYTNETKIERIFNITKQSLLSEDYLYSESVLDVLYVQYLLLDFAGTDFETEIFELLNLTLQMCHTQASDIEPYQELYNFKQNLVLKPGNTQDCSIFNNIQTSASFYFIQNELNQGFKDFIQSYYPGLENFVELK